MEDRRNYSKNIEKKRRLMPFLPLYPALYVQTIISTRISLFRYRLEGTISQSEILKENKH